MIRKTIIGLLVLATLGIVVLWAFAFFGDPYMPDWDLTDRVWCMVILAPGTCEVIVAKLLSHPEWGDVPKPHIEILITAVRDSQKGLDRLRTQYNHYGFTPLRPSMPTTLGFGLHFHDSATVNFSGSATWYVMFPSWALLILGSLLGAYPAVVFIRPFRRAWRLRNGWCLACGYDLQGNVSGRCSECGEDVEGQS